MPAAAARIRSASVPCGISSASTSPLLYIRTKAVTCEGWGVAVKAQHIFFTCPAAISVPTSTLASTVPALLEMPVRPLAP